MRQFQDEDDIVNRDDGQVICEYSRHRYGCDNLEGSNRFDDVRLIEGFARSVHPGD